MIPVRNIYIAKDQKIADILLTNPLFILILEHLGIKSVVEEQTIEHLCNEKNINPSLLIAFLNLHNGVISSGFHEYKYNDLQTIIVFLRNSHHYYLNEKYPEIRFLVEQLKTLNDHAAISMLEHFFDEYFNEVKEHLRYEDQFVFPYIHVLLESLTSKNTDTTSNTAYSVTEYREHHDDIEEKLADLKNLLIKHLPIENDLQIRRKLLFSLFELEQNLHTHSLIEDQILIPLVEKLENHLKA